MSNQLTVDEKLDRILSILTEDSVPVSDYEKAAQRFDISAQIIELQRDIIQTVLMSEESLPVSTIINDIIASNNWIKIQKLEKSLVESEEEVLVND